MSLPFRLATTRTGAKNHLVLHSPRVQGLAPDALHTTTLCCRPVHGLATDTNPGDVECRICLHLAPIYMRWPTFSTHHPAEGETP